MTAQASYADDEGGPGSVPLLPDIIAQAAQDSEPRFWPELVHDDTHESSDGVAYMLPENPQFHFVQDLVYIHPAAERRGCSNEVKRHD